jgi:hypothetical protein
MTHFLLVKTEISFSGFICQLIILLCYITIWGMATALCLSKFLCPGLISSMVYETSTVANKDLVVHDNGHFHTGE